MRWSKPELDYLKSNYDKFSTEDLKQNLYNYFWNDRSISSIRVKAHRVGLRRF